MRKETIVATSKESLDSFNHFENNCELLYLWVLLISYLKKRRKIAWQV